MDDSIREKLRELIARRGVGLCATAEACKQAVNQLCRNHPTEKYVLVNILEMGMLNQILALSSEEAWPALAQDLAERMTKERGLHESAARWGLNSWAVALGKIGESELSETGSQQLGKQRETTSFPRRLLAAVVAGAVVGSICWLVGVVVSWGLQGSWGPWGGALIGAAAGAVRGFRDLVLTPFVVAGWALGGFFAAVLISGMQFEVVPPLSGVLAWVIAAGLGRALLVMLSNRQPQRVLQAVAIGGILGCAVGWPVAVMLTSQATEWFELPWSWCLAAGAAGVLHTFLDFSLQSLKAVLGAALLRGLVGAAAGAIVGYLSGDGGFLGWPIAGALLWALPGALSLPLERHAQAVWGVAISPSGNFALSASADGTIGLWQLDDRSLVGFFQGHEQATYCVAFSHDGTYCVSGSSDATVRVVDGEDGDEVFCFRGHTDTVLSVAFSPDDRFVASASADGTIRVWDLDEEKEQHSLQGHAGPVTSVAFSPEGDSILSGSLDGSARLWDAASGKELAQFSGQGAIHAVVFTPGGKHVIVAGDDTLRLWSTDERRVERAFAGHTGPVHGLSISLDGRRLLSAGGDGTVRLWDVATGKQVFSLADHEGPVRSVAFAPNGRSALSGGDDGTVRLLKLPLPG